jgi:hypothetical protein
MFKWESAVGKRPPDGAIVCGSEGSGRDLFACFARQSPSAAPRFGKMGIHLGGGAGITSTSGTQEVAPEAGDVLSVLCYYPAAHPDVPVWVPWVDVLVAGGVDVSGYATVPGRGATGVIGCATYRGSRHPCAVDLEAGTATVLWGGKANRLSAFDDADDLELTLLVVKSTAVAAGIDAGALSPAAVNFSGFEGIRDMGILAALTLRGARPDPLACGALSSLAELMEWRPVAGTPSPSPPGRLAKHAARVADGGANLPPRDAPQLLLCHDFRGGYLGSDTGHFGSTADAEAYTVERWPSVDVFCFFAHRMVAVPPAEWIAAAHRHGVPCIGTFIVEHSAEVLWPLLSGALPPVAVAEQLARLAAHYGFDGWLLNIEVNVPAATVPVVLEWIAAVTLSCTQLIGPQAVVLWYDSVCVDGVIKYQNALSRRNVAFARRCHGLFSNYWWTPAMLTQSAELARAEGMSPAQVFHGTDAFGRNTYGGGGFRSHVAVGAAFAAGVSSALFAPGWTLEVAATQRSEATARERFRAADRQFWEPIAMHTRCNEFCVAAYPFTTSFVEAAGGNAFYVQGHRCRTHTSWCKVSFQEPAPLDPAALAATWKVAGAVSYHTDDAFFGGRCLRCEASAATAPGSEIAFPLMLVANAALPEAGTYVELVVKFASGQRVDAQRLTVSISASPSASDAARSNADSVRRVGATDWWIATFTVRGQSRVPGVSVLSVAGSLPGPLLIGRVHLAAEPPASRQPTPNGGTLILQQRGAARDVACPSWYLPPQARLEDGTVLLVATLEDALTGATERFVLGGTSLPYPHVETTFLPAEAVLKSATILHGAFSGSQDVVEEIPVEIERV